MKPQERYSEGGSPFLKDLSTLLPRDDRRQRKGIDAIGTLQNHPNMPSTVLPCEFLLVGVQGLSNPNHPATERTASPSEPRLSTSQVYYLTDDVDDNYLEVNYFNHLWQSSYPNLSLPLVDHKTEVRLTWQLHALKDTSVPWRTTTHKLVQNVNKPIMLRKRDWAEPISHLLQHIHKKEQERHFRQHHDEQIFSQTDDEGSLSDSETVSDSSTCPTPSLRPTTTAPDCLRSQTYFSGPYQAPLTPVSNCGRKGRSAQRAHPRMRPDHEPMTPESSRDPAFDSDYESDHDMTVNDCLVEDNEERCSTRAVSDSWRAVSKDSDRYPARSESTEPLNRRKPRGRRPRLPVDTL